jgi:peptidoglycan/xylan/chitin deacetylase (PgdA/CDA1 family)
LRTNHIIQQLTGKTPLFARPPFGAMNQIVKQQMIDNGYTIIQWSLDTRDWKGTEAQKILQKVKSQLDPGDIILQHSAGGRHNLHGTVNALPHIIHLLKKRGYQLVTVEELLNTPAYKSVKTKNSTSIKASYSMN